MSSIKRGVGDTYMQDGALCLMIFSQSLTINKHSQATGGIEIATLTSSSQPANTTMCKPEMLLAR